MSQEGAIIERWVESREDLRLFVNKCLRAGILRCTSPERAELCDNPATMVFWNDIAEFYPCCEAHHVAGPHWTGSTSFHPHKLVLCVLPAQAYRYLQGLSRQEREKIQTSRYRREVVDDG